MTNVTRSLFFLLNKPAIDKRFIATLREGNLRKLQSSYSPGLVSATKGAQSFGVPKNQQVPQDVRNVQHHEDHNIYKPQPLHTY